MSRLSTFVYSRLLLLLPRALRRQYGPQMLVVFEEALRDARRAGRLAVVLLWLRELAGLGRFAILARLRKPGGLARVDAPAQSAGWPLRSLRTEARWALRSLRARRAQAALSIALLATTLAANGVVFATADSLAFRRDDFPDLDRLVLVQGRDANGRTISGFPADLIPALREHRDIFVSIHGVTGSSVLLNRSGEPQSVRAAWITPGLIEMLGGSVLAGRAFTDADREPEAQEIAILREDLAREHFGNAHAAVGQILEAATGPLRVVGVLPRSFRFPGGADRLWRPLDLARRPEGRVPSLLTIALLRPDVPPDTLASVLDARSAVLTAQTAIARGWPHVIATAPFTARYGAGSHLVYWLLLGAAGCLLLTTCASLAGLELASIATRTRNHAIASALGASRASLLRTVTIEVALQTVAAVALAWLLSSWATTVLASSLPDTLTTRSTNLIDVDARALAFISAAACLSWLLASLPVVLYASRARASSALRVDARAGAPPAAALARRILAAAQVAIAVLLLIGAGLSLRSYRALVTIDRGFDSSNLIALSVTVPPSLPRSAPALEALTADILAKLRSQAAVVGATASPEVPPHVWGERVAGPLEIEGDAPAGMAVLTRVPVAPDYFSVLRLPLRAGRIFDAGAPPTEVVVSETFARRHWPGGRSVGRRFRLAGDRQWNEVIGVVARVRSEFDRLGHPSEVEYEFYVAARPARPENPAAPPARAPLYATLSFPVRVADRAGVSLVAEAVRAIDRRLLVKTELVDERYAALDRDVRVATTVGTTFGALACGIALTGVYGVMAFLLAGRRREIAIRMALGARPADVSRAVFRSAALHVCAGAAAGVLGAWAASRYLTTQLYGISPTDAGTYAFVTASVIAAALLAIWRPVRRAARVSPSVALRAD